MLFEMGNNDSTWSGFTTNQITFISFGGQAIHMLLNSCTAKVLVLDNTICCIPTWGYAGSHKTYIP